MSTFRWQGEAVMARFRAAVDEGVTRMAAVAAETARARMGGNTASLLPGQSRSTYTSSKPGGYPGRRTGHLARSITHTRAVRGVAQYGTNVKYGRYLEYGANPRGRPLLAIPLSGLAETLRIRHGGTRNIPGLRLVRTKRNLFLVRHVRGHHARSEFLFLLTPSVRIAPRPWIHRAAREAIPAMRRVFVATMAERGFGR